MLNHVLIPLDGSLLAETALPEAKRLVVTNGHITLVTAIDMPQIPLYGIDVPMNIVTPARNEVEESVRHAHNYLNNIATDLQIEGYQVHIVVSMGEAATVIVETAEQKHVDAIVISTHGRSGITRWLLGSVTNKVLDAAPCPIYVVPHQRKQEAPQRVVVKAAAVS